MSIIPRVLAAGGLLAVPALLAVGSQALSRPAEVPPLEPQTVTVDLAPPEAVGTGAEADGDGSTTATPAPSSPADLPAAPAPPSPAPPASPAPAQPSPPQPLPALPAPPAVPAEQGTPGLVERQVLGDDGGMDDGDDADDGVEVDDDAGLGGED